MNKTLSVFMVVSCVSMIVTFLIIGVVFQALYEKNDIHQDNLQTKHQLSIK